MDSVKLNYFQFLIRALHYINYLKKKKIMRRRKDCLKETKKKKIFKLKRHRAVIASKRWGHAMVFESICLGPIVIEQLIAERFSLI